MLKLHAGIFVVIASCSWVLADVSECIGKCPVQTSIDSPVTFLTHQNCEMYCVCNYGKPIEMPCPAGLHFASKWNTCADPTVAECAGYNPDSLVNSVQTEKENDFIFIDSCIGKCTIHENSSEIILLAHANSKMYCRCKNGLPIIKSCSIGHHFDSEEGTCMPQNEANHS